MAERPKGDIERKQREPTSPGMRKRTLESMTSREGAARFYPEVALTPFAEILDEYPNAFRLDVLNF